MRKCRLNRELGFDDRFEVDITQYQREAIVQKVAMS